MTKRIQLLAVAMGALGYTFFGATREAQAQYVRPAVSPYARPAVSPYLNLLRSGNPAVNYYGLVRPQQDTISSLQQLQQQADYGQGLGGDNTATLPTTGHAARFGNYSHYFGGVNQAPLNIAPLNTRPLNVPQQGTSGRRGF